MASLTNVYSNYRSTNTDLTGRQDITTPSGSIGFKNITNQYLYIPVGSIFPYAGSTAPKQYLLCDGSAVSRAKYIALFNIIGTTYGTGNGSTTFNVPNLKGHVPFGLDATDPDFTPLGSTGGASYHTLTIAEMPTHNHSGVTSITGLHTHTVTDPGHIHGVTDPGHNHSIPTAEGAYASIGPNDNIDRGTETTGSSTTGITVNTNTTGITNVATGDHQHAIANQGGSLPHNNLPPYIVLNYIIKF